MSMNEQEIIYDALNFDGLERRANYRMIAYREDVLHALDKREGAAILYHIVYRWQTEYKRDELLKKIDERKKKGQKPFTPQEIEDMMWVYMSYNDFVRETGGALGYNTVIRLISYLVNEKKVLLQRANHDPKYPDYEYSIHKDNMKALLKELPVDPAFAPKIPKKKHSSTHLGTSAETTDDCTHLGRLTDELGSTQMGTGSTQMGTEVYPNGGTSQNTHSNPQITHKEKEDVQLLPPSTHPISDDAAQSSSPLADEKVPSSEEKQDHLVGSSNMAPDEISQTTHSPLKPVEEDSTNTTRSTVPRQQAPTTNEKRPNDTPSQQKQESGVSCSQLSLMGEQPAKTEKQPKTKKPKEPTITERIEKLRNFFEGLYGELLEDPEYHAESIGTPFTATFKAAKKAIEQGVSEEGARMVIDGLWDDCRDGEFFWRDPNHLTFRAFCNNYHSRLASIRFKQKQEEKKRQGTKANGVVVVGQYTFDPSTYDEGELEYAGPVRMRQ